MFFYQLSDAPFHFQLTLVDNGNPVAPVSTSPNSCDEKKTVLPSLFNR